MKQLNKLKEKGFNLALFIQIKCYLMHLKSLQEKRNIATVILRRMNSNRRRLSIDRRLLWLL
jgi:uncharacterized protein YlxP (DUF503 family)